MHAHYTIATEIDTIRHKDCHILVPSSSTRCYPCETKRTSLRAQLCKSLTTNSSLSKTTVQSRTNFSNLSREDLMTRLRNACKQMTSTNRKLAYTKAKLASVVESHGHSVDTQSHEDLTTMAEKYRNIIASQHPSGSFARLFWDQQLKAAHKKDSRGMRWHPLMIKWAIYLHYRSSGAYETLRSSGVIALPSQRSLRDYTHAFQEKCGFSAESDQQLVSHPDLRGVEDWKRHVVLLLDELHIKEDLVYNKHTGALVGFVNLSDITVHLEEFE